jgi:glycosyltransferase involved in cell wall biosynthesis
MISFVIPCYNYGRYLPECLNSIFVQEGGFDIEVIAVEDGSTDNTLEVLRSFSDPRLRIIEHGKNQGFLAAVTHGLEAARGKYVARIDPDDRYRPNFLATLVPVLESHPKVGMAYGDAAMIDATGRRTAERCDNVHGGKDFLGNELIALMERHYICAPTALSRREAWLAALPIPPPLAFIDVWFNLMIARDWDYCYKNVVVADYRVHPENWHVRIINERSEESSLLWLLDFIYSTPERSPELEAAKQRARGRIYGEQYLTLAVKYFGRGMAADARRCYLRAARYLPSSLLRPRVARYLAASCLGIERYNALKAVFKI